MGLDLAGLGGSVNSRESAGGIGGLLAIHDVDATPAPADSDGNFIVFYDANGNVGQLVDWGYDVGSAIENGWDDSRLVARYEYDPYGNVIGPDTNGDGVFEPDAELDPDDPGVYADENPFRWSTKYWDDETGLGYWGYRYYDPALGRWISRDPIGEAGGACLYAYAINRPTGIADALGRYPLGGFPAENPVKPESQSRSGCCGPDITYALEHSLQYAQGHFNNLSERDKYNVCNQMINPGAGDGFGWDINELMAWGSADGDPEFEALQSKGCGTGDCAGSVQVAGRCQRAADVN